MGQLLGYGVRFGAPASVMAAGEGIETILSLRQIAPALPMIAALSAAHLGALCFPTGLKRLYVARDDDAAGETAYATLYDRARPAGIEVIALEAERGDFNADLMMLGQSRMIASLRSQLHSSDGSYLH